MIAGDLQQVEGSLHGITHLNIHAAGSLRAEAGRIGDAHTLCPYAYNPDIKPP